MDENRRVIASWVADVATIEAALAAHEEATRG